MARYTTEYAQKQLDGWLSAQEALASAQSYSIAGRTFTSADINTIMRMISFWQRELEKSLGLKQRRSYQFVPYDR